MNIDIFSDVVCPWCAIGKRRFEAALERFEHATEVEVRWRAFELDPAAPAISDVDVATRLAQKHGIPREQAVANHQRMTALAAQDGLDFHFESARRGNTFDAHRLLHYAYEVGLQDELKERLFRAYFSEAEPIGDRSTLVRLAAQVGLDASKTTEILEDGRYAAEVRADEREAQELGIGGVPFFVVDGHFGISGAQSPEVILQVLEQAWQRTHPPLTAIGDDGVACEGDACEL